VAKTTLRNIRDFLPVTALYSNGCACTVYNRIWVIIIGFHD